jgi:hypothetical protein
MFVGITWQQMLRGRIRRDVVKCSEEFSCTRTSQPTHGDQSVHRLSYSGCTEENHGTSKFRLWKVNSDCTAIILASTFCYWQCSVQIELNKLPRKPLNFEMTSLSCSVKHCSSLRISWFCEAQCNYKHSPWLVVLKRPPLVGEISANFSG